MWKRSNISHIQNARCAAVISSISEANNIFHDALLYQECLFALEIPNAFKSINQFMAAKNIRSD
jgi:hypothetical protein